MGLVQYQYYNFIRPAITFHSSVHSGKIKERSITAPTHKDTFILDVEETDALHWVGKLLPNLTGNEEMAESWNVGTFTHSRFPTRYGI